MSKKTIAFTMPAPAPRSGERAPVIIDAAAEPSRGGSASETDEWVRDPDLRGADEPRRMAVLPPPRFFEMGGSVTIDLAADRSLMEAVALSWMTPFALGWFWYVNAITRRQRMWGL